MSNYNSLKTTIDANIKQNGRQEITGQILNSVLNQMVNTLGAGYQFAGVATTATNPGSPDAKVFYIANGKGTYTNFGGLQVTEDDVVVLYWDSSWHKVSTGIASQVGLAELKLDLYGGREEGVEIDLADTTEGSFSEYLGYSIGNGKTLFYYTHKGEEFKIVAKDRGVLYAWLPKNTYVDGEIASTVDGKTRATTISAGTTSIITSPADSYLSIRMNAFSGTDYSPRSVTKLGALVEGDIPSLDERLSKIEEETESSMEHWNNLPTANGAWSYIYHDKRWTSDFKSVLNVKVKAGDVFVGRNVISTSAISLLTEVDEEGAFVGSLIQGTDGRRNVSYVFTKDAIINISLSNADASDITKGFILHFTKMGLISHFMSNHLGEKYATLGDSITFRGHWQQIVNYYTGMGEKNYACSGMFVGGFGFFYPNGGSESSSATGGAVASRLLNAQDFEGCSHIIICGYANNMYANGGMGTPMGTMADSFISMSEQAAAQASSVNAYRLTITAQAFIPQVKSTIDYILRIAPSAKVILAGALQMSSSQAPGFHATNGNGYTTEDYSEAMKKVAEWYGLPYVDLEHNGGVNEVNSATYYSTPNDVHPNYAPYDGERYPVSGMAKIGEAVVKAL